MVADHSPRSAAVLLSGALAHLDVIQPPDLRGPVRDILRAGVEMCVGTRSLLGKPIVHTIRLAQTIMDVAAEGEKRKDQGGS